MNKLCISFINVVFSNYKTIYVYLIRILMYTHIRLCVLKRFTRTKTPIPIKLPPTKQLIIITTLVPGPANVKTYDSMLFTIKR